MTLATKAIYKLLLSNYVKVSNVSVEDMLYDEQDILRSMDKIEVSCFLFLDVCFILPFLETSNSFLEFFLIVRTDFEANLNASVSLICCKGLRFGSFNLFIFWF